LEGVQIASVPVQLTIKLLGDRLIVLCRRGVLFLGILRADHFRRARRDLEAVIDIDAFGLFGSADLIAVEQACAIPVTVIDDADNRNACTDFAEKKWGPLCCRFAPRSSRRRSPHG